MIPPYAQRLTLDEHRDDKISGALPCTRFRYLVKRHVRRWRQRGCLRHGPLFRPFPLRSRLKTFGPLLCSFGCNRRRATRQYHHAAGMDGYAMPDPTSPFVEERSSTSYAAYICVAHIYTRGDPFLFPLTPLFAIQMIASNFTTTTLKPASSSFGGRGGSSAFRGVPRSLNGRVTHRIVMIA